MAGRNLHYVSNVDKASHLITREKNILKEKFATKFRGYDTDEDGEICNNQVTDDLQQYIDQVKRNVNVFMWLLFIFACYVAISLSYYLSIMCHNVFSYFISMHEERWKILRVQK